MMPISVFNTNTARADERYDVGVESRNSPFADEKRAVNFFIYFACI